MSHLSSAIDRIERKLDNPLTGPSWVAVTSLFVSISAVISGAVIGFVILTGNPLRADIVEIKKEMLVDDTREREDSQVLVKLTEKSERTDKDTSMVFMILARMNTEDDTALRTENSELRRSLERARELLMRENRP